MVSHFLLVGSEVTWASEFSSPHSWWFVSSFRRPEQLRGPCLVPVPQSVTSVRIGRGDGGSYPWGSKSAGRSLGLYQFRSYTLFVSGSPRGRFQPSPVGQRGYGEFFRDDPAK